MLRHLLFIGLTLANWGFARDKSHNSVKPGGPAPSSNVVASGTYEHCARRSETSPKLSCWRSPNDPPEDFNCGAFAGLFFSKVTVSGNTLVDAQKRILPCTNPTQNTATFSPFSRSNPTRRTPTGF